MHTEKLNRLRAWPGGCGVSNPDYSIARNWSERALEGITLRRGGEKPLLRMLPMDLQVLRHFGRQLGHDSEMTIDVAATRAFAPHDPAYDHLIARTTGNQCLDRGRFLTRSDARRISFAAQQQLESLDQQGLAGTGFTGERGHARAKVET